MTISTYLIKEQGRRKMRIKKISIGRYKNLHDFECEFSDSNISAFIGNNGSGKSNLLEVITKAFSNAKNFAAGKNLPFSLEPVLTCVIEYELHGTDYVLRYNYNADDILAKLAKEPSVPIRDEISVCCGEKILTKKEIDAALPDSILLYYAGETLRQKGNAESTYDRFYEEKLKRANSSALPALYFMDYYSIGDLPLLLLTAAVYKGSYYEKFLSFVNCSEISSKFSFILKNPGKGKGTADTYWNATGFVKYFLDCARRFVTGTRDQSESQYFMFFDAPEKFRAISTNEFDLFAKLKALRHYGYLEHIGIELVKNDGTTFSSLRLSEGEKQLGLLMLLSSFTAGHECLYLFDEFDAYLHLNWQRQFASNIANTGVAGHILFTTHSPASISQVTMDSLFIMKNGQAIYPESETYNRALDEIMFEQMDVTMHSPEIEKLYEHFKQCIANRDKEAAEKIQQQLVDILNPKDPLLLKLRMTLRRL